MQLAQFKLLLATLSIISVFAVATLYRLTKDRPAIIPAARKNSLPVVDSLNSITSVSPRKRLPNVTNTDAEAQRSTPLSTATTIQREPNIQHQITPRLTPPS